MSTLRITLAAAHIGFAVDDLVAAIPVGIGTLADGIESDPPRPEELTNAIGLVLDHMEDAVREAPGIGFADRIEVAGDGVDVLAAVEVGRAVDLPLELPREAAEDVFRTLATEARAERRRNPGLPAEHVHRILGTSSAIVAVMRKLQAESVWLVTGGEE